MIIVHQSEILSALCQKHQMWGLYISFFLPDGDSWEKALDEVVKAAPYLDEMEYVVVLSQNEGYILVDSKEAMENLYNQTVGDDGPTSLNPYNGPARVYALTCNPAGQVLTENT